MILLDILGDLWQEKPVGFPVIFALVMVVAFGWAWLTQSQKIRGLLATEPEPGQKILRKQMQAYRVTIILLLWTKDAGHPRELSEIVGRAFVVWMFSGLGVPPHLSKKLKFPHQFVSNFRKRVKSP